MDLPCQCQGQTLWCCRAPNFPCHRETQGWPSASRVNRGERSCNHSGGNTSMFMCRAALSLGVWECCCTSVVEMSRLEFSSTVGPLAESPSWRGSVWLTIFTGCLMMMIKVSGYVSIKVIYLFCSDSFWVCLPEFIMSKSVYVKAQWQLDLWGSWIKSNKVATKWIVGAVSLEQEIEKVSRSEEI